MRQHGEALRALQRQGEQVILRLINGEEVFTEALFVLSNFTTLAGLLAATLDKLGEQQEPFDATS